MQEQIIIHQPSASASHAAAPAETLAAEIVPAETISAGTPPGEPARRPFQYSLRSMFIVTTVVAVLCSALFASPGWCRLLTALLWSFVYPPILLTIVIYGRDYVRTFCIGAFSVISSLFVGSSCYLIIIAVFYGASSTEIESNWSDFVKSCESLGYGPAIFVFGTLLLSFLVGLVMVLTRWLIERTRRIEEQRRSLPKPFRISEN
jgi:hypothetical protein